VLRHRVVDGDDRQLQDPVLLHRAEADHAGRRLFHARHDVADQPGPLVGREGPGPAADLGVQVVQAVQGDEDHGADEVGAVVHRHVRLMLQRGGDVR
jgi:hypothetical protein